MTVQPAQAHVEARHTGGRLVVWPPARAAIEAILTEHTLYSWAEIHEQRSVLPGRGSVFTVPAPTAGPDGRDRWAVRRYWRGGAMAMHMGDRHLRLGRSRPHREALAARVARRRGIRTPAVVAGATYVDGPYYRCDLVTEVVPEVETLAQALHRHDGTKEWALAMARAGALMRTLYAAGVHHVDLNAHNVLLPLDGRAPAWVVDLDRARVLRGPSAAARAQMEERLTRSVTKVGTPTGEMLRHAEIERALAREPEEL